VDGRACALILQSSWLQPDTRVQPQPHGPKPNNDSAQNAAFWTDQTAAHDQQEGVLPMAEGDKQQQQIQLRIDESKMHNTYSNTIRTSTTADEVVLDFGMNLPMQGNDGNPAILFTVGSRVIMNWVGAKRLAISLGQVIRQYEERNGEIQLQRAPRPGEGGSGPRLSED